jgi:hypothetical protein
VYNQQYIAIRYLFFIKFINNSEYKKFICKWSDSMLNTGIGEVAELIKTVLLASASLVLGVAVTAGCMKIHYRNHIPASQMDRVVDERFQEEVRDFYSPNGCKQRVQLARERVKSMIANSPESDKAVKELVLLGETYKKSVRFSKVRRTLKKLAFWSKKSEKKKQKNNQDFVKQQGEKLDGVLNGIIKVVEKVVPQNSSTN